MWDFSKHSPLTVERLRLSSPDGVAAALDEYGRYHVTKAGYSFDGEELEQALVERGDRLIDLALAKNATSRELLAAYYQRGRANLGEAAYDRALCLAVIENQAAGASGFLNVEYAGLTEAEVRRLAMEGDDVELSALLQNPARRGLLAALFLRKGPFEGLPDDRLRKSIRYATLNPNLNLDDDSPEGPDFTFWDIQKGVADLAFTTPLTPDWLRVMHELLLRISPFGYIGSVAPERVLDLLRRLQSVKVPRMFSRDDEEEQGDFTGLTFVEDYRCIVGALYGYTLVEGKAQYVGPEDSPDLAVRFAWHARRTMDVKQMLAAMDKEQVSGDGWPRRFTFAALFNQSLLLRPETRQELENRLVGSQRSLYAARCLSLQAKYPNFDARPVTAELAEEAPQKPQPADAVALQRVQDDLAKLRAQVAKAATSASWAFIVIIIGMVAIYRH